MITIKTMKYQITDLIEFFENEKNFAAVEWFNDVMASGIVYVTKKALYSLFDEDYAQYVVENI
jgi:hypothetical protein